MNGLLDNQGIEVSRRRKTVFSFMLFICFCLFIAGIGELAVRILSPSGYITPDIMRENSLEYQSTVFARSVYPQRKQFAEDGRVHINSLGYRGRDISIRKTGDVVRIICLGGSQVLDGAQAENKNWPALLEKILRDKNINVEVINAGVAGNASCDSLGRLYSEIWMLKPDYIVICHAWNDLKYFKRLSPETSLLRSIMPPKVILKDGIKLVWNPYIYYTGRLDKFMCHSQLYVRLRNRYWSFKLGSVGFEGLITGKIKTNSLNRERKSMGTEKEQWSNNWAINQYALNMKLIVAATKAIGATPILLTQPRLSTSNTSAIQRKRIMYGYIGLSHQELVDAFNKCDQALRDIAKEEKVQLIETKALTGHAGLFRDHVHLSAEGSEKLAELIAKKMLPVYSVGTEQAEIPKQEE